MCSILPVGAQPVRIPIMINAHVTCRTVEKVHILQDALHIQ